MYQESQQSKTSPVEKRRIFITKYYAIGNNELNLELDGICSNVRFHNFT